MTFKAHESSNTQPDMIQDGAQTAALRSFNQALLFQTAMIHFNAPRGDGISFPLRFAHLLKARRPIFRCADGERELEIL